MAYRKLGRDSSARKALFRSVLVALFKNEKIETTVAKAKEVSGLAAKMITLAKQGDLHARRQVLAFLVDEQVTTKLFDEIAPKGFAFSHGLGHGIGINVHETPPNLSVSKLAKTKLVPNMCFTIEPGLYKAGSFGIRLENSCYLEKTSDSLRIKSFSNICFEKELIDYTRLTKTEKRQLEEFEVK